MNLWTEQRPAQVNQALLVGMYQQGLSGQVELGKGGVAESEQQPVKRHPKSIHSAAFSPHFVIFLFSGLLL